MVPINEKNKIIMKKMNDVKEIDNLEDELQEFLNDAEKVLGYKTEGINDTINDLMSFNTKNSIELTKDILDVENDLILTEEFFTEEDDDSFNEF